MMAGRKKPRFSVEDIEGDPEEIRPTVTPSAAKVHYVLAQEGLVKQARRDPSVPEGAKVVEKVPMARLTDECEVSVLFRGELSEPLRVADHWNEDALLVHSSPFLRALGALCSPLTVRLRGDWLSLVWA